MTSDESSVNVPPDRGESLRFREFYEANASSIFAFASRAGLGRVEAQDILAETFLIAWRRLGDVPPSPEDRLWLFGVARNLIAKSRRKHVRNIQLLTVLRNERTTVASRDGEADSGLLQAIEQLPEKEREVIHLIIWEQLTHQEAAIILGCSPNATRLRLHRAKQHLLRRFER